jgi:hypothetical protein
VTRKQVDTARAEVKAFRAIGRTPAPVVVRIAEAAPAEPTESAAAPTPVGG